MREQTGLAITGEGLHAGHGGHVPFVHGLAFCFHCGDECRFVELMRQYHGYPDQIVGIGAFQLQLWGT